MPLLALIFSPQGPGPCMASGAQRPRRRTPDHPPYAMMIGEAIRSLAEEGGSTEAAISRHIRSNYDDLPWGHDRLLPYYLKKLTALGEFVAVAPGRYLVAEYPDAEEPAMASKTIVHEGKVARPLENRSCGEDGEDSSLPMVNEGCAVEPLMSLPPSPPQIEAHRVEEGVAVEAKDDDGGSSMMAKHTGRKRRRKIDSSENSKAPIDDDHAVAKSMPGMLVDSRSSASKPMNHVDASLQLKPSTTETGGDGSLSPVSLPEPMDVEGHTAEPKPVPTLPTKAHDAVSLAEPLPHEGNAAKQLEPLRSEDAGGGSLALLKRQGRRRERKTKTASSSDGIGLSWPLPSRVTRSSSVSKTIATVDHSPEAKPTSIENAEDDHSLPMPSSEPMSSEALAVDPPTAQNGEQHMPLVSSEPLVQEGDVVKQFESLTTKESEDGFASAHKRRRRRPKRKTNPAEHSDVTLDSRQLAKDRTQPKPSCRTRSLAVSRPIGDADPPLKMKLTSTEMVGDGSSLPSTAYEPGSFQGGVQPSKSLPSSAPLKAHNDNELMFLPGSEAPAKDVNAAEQFGSLNGNGDAPVTKRRGRPPKRKAGPTTYSEVRLSSKMMAEDCAETESKSVQGTYRPVSSRTQSTSAPKPTTKVNALAQPEPATVECNEDGSTLLIDTIEDSKMLPVSATTAHNAVEAIHLVAAEPSAQEGSVVKQRQSLNTRDSGGGSAQVPKRRGRPPKVKPSPPGTGVRSDSKQKAEDHTETGKGASSSLTTRRTGSSSVLKPMPNVDPSVHKELSIDGDAAKSLKSSPHTKAHDPEEVMALPFSGSSANKGDVVGQFQSTIGVDGMADSLPAAKRRGRPPKRKPKAAKNSKNGALRPITPSGMQSSSVTQLIAVARTSLPSRPVAMQSDQDGSSLQPTSTQDGSVSAGEHVPALVHAMPRDSKNQGDGSQPSPSRKRRRRPPKSKSDSLEKSLASMDAGNYGQRGAKAKKDNNEPKSLPRMVNEDGSDSPLVPKRRGRPPKQKPVV